MNVLPIPHGKISLSWWWGYAFPLHPLYFLIKYAATH